MTISVIIPTLNEAAHIPQQIASIREKVRGQKVEIIVADAESEDGTAHLAKKAGARVITIPKSARAIQMNAGARAAKGDIFYFVHADLTLPEGFDQDILEGVQNGKKYGCYQVRFDTDNKGLHFNSRLSKYQGICFRGGDQTLYMTKTLFEEVGGFAEDIVIMEDYEILLRARKYGKIHIMPKKVVISSRKVEENGYFRANITNFLVFTMFFLGFSQKTLVRVYRFFVKGTKYQIA